MTKVFTSNDVASHTSADSAWIILRGKVYDVTSFLDDHPGGKKILLKACGKDSTAQFEKFHDADRVLKEHGPELEIGSVASSKL